MAGGGRRIAILAAACLLVVVVRLSWQGTSEFRAGERFAEAGDVHEACVRYGRAIHLYLPLSPLPGKAGGRILGLADGVAETEPRLARFCLEELRGGLLAIRSTWQPRADLVAEAEERLVPLMIDDPRGAWPDPQLPAAEREAIAAAALAEREDPALLWVLVMGVGWVLWIGGAALAIVRGVPSSAQAPVDWGVVLRFGGAAVVGYGLWLAGVAFA